MSTAPTSSCDSNSNSLFIQVPLSEVTSVGGRRSSKKRKLSSRPPSQLTRGIPTQLTEGSPGNVIIHNPHNAAAVYMSGCYGKGSLSKGPPLGCLDRSEHLILTPCEAFYLITSNAIKVLNLNNEVVSSEELWRIWTAYNAIFPHLYKVYKHFRDKGYVVRSGLTYGGDFVLYTGDPNTGHAPYVVRVVCGAQSSYPPQWNDINSVRRVSESVAKELIMAFVSFSGLSGCNVTACDSATVRTVLLKRWIPSRDRELTGKNEESTG